MTGEDYILYSEAEIGLFEDSSANTVRENSLRQGADFPIKARKKIILHVTELAF